VLPALYAVFTIPVSYRTLQSTPFDMIYFNGIAAVVKEHLGITHDSPDLRVQKRSPMPVPTLTPKPARPRNVLLILQESQRADVTCSEYDPDCQLCTRFSNPLVPNRLPLLDLRANASTTAISISNLWTGVRPTEGRETLHAVPLIWEYARAAGFDSAYWTSQNLMFGNARLYVQDIPVRTPVRRHGSCRPISTPAPDALVTDRADRGVGRVQELSSRRTTRTCTSRTSTTGARAPSSRRSDKTRTRTRSSRTTTRTSSTSDMAVGVSSSHIRSTDAGSARSSPTPRIAARLPRALAVSTRARSTTRRSTCRLIDAPEGTLAPEEEASLRREGRVLGT
jgi:hypothetical protein